MFIFTWWRERRRALARIEQSLARIEGIVNLMPSTEQELSDKLDRIATGVQALKDLIATLEAGVVTQAQLDDLNAKADAILSNEAPPAPIS